MSVSDPDPDVLITDSGGRMVRLPDVGTPPAPADLSVLADFRRVDLPGPYRGLGVAMTNAASWPGSRPARRSTCGSEGGEGQGSCASHRPAGRGRSGNSTTTRAASRATT